MNEDKTLQEIIKEAQHNLDLFNLEVAKFRVKSGVSPQLIHLYGNMGRLSGSLMAIESEAGKVDNLWHDITELFETMRLKIEVDTNDK